MFGGGGGLPWDGPIKTRVLLRMEYSVPPISSSAAAIAATDPFQFDSGACLLVPAVGGFASCVGTCTSSSSDISLWNSFVPSKSNTVASDWKRRVKRLVILETTCYGGARGTKDVPRYLMSKSCCCCNNVTT